MPIPVPGPAYTATHGSIWDYDRRVPLLFWRKGLTGFEQPSPVETVDIAPLYGAMDRRAQDLAVSPASKGRRKIVLATNVAETSITVDGVSATYATESDFCPGNTAVR